MSKPARDDGQDSVLLRLEASGRSAPRLRLTGDGDAAPSPIALRSSARYEVVGEIARGGVGVVLRGRDVDLGRDVAMKVLREDHVGSADLARRFVEEAQVGGQLQHPGIVPVYELGLQPDGRPFFAMKLVKGGTLAQALAARKGEDEDRRRFLAVFEQACQTMAYAHSRGVVHRDLKPSNVMIGAFGEVQVVDWGFAKVLAAGGVADEKRAKREVKGTTIVATVRSGSSGSGSVAGSVMGTPSYMPPEQALGHVEHVDERSDVFSLGAILCEILTGAPPYVGDDLLAQAAQCRLDDARARLDACGADDALVQLARACLSLLPKDRPKNASEVAAAVSTYLAEVDERAHRSKLQAIEAKAKAEKALAAAEEAKLDAAARVRARRQTRAIAAAVLVAVVAAGGTWAVLDARRAGRVRATAAAVDEAVQDATRFAAAREWTEALAAADRALELATAGDIDAARVNALLAEVRSRESAARDLVAQDEKDRRFLDTLDELRTRSGSEPWHRIDAEQVAAWRRYGIDVESMNVRETADQIRSRGAEFASRLAVTLDNWVHQRTVWGQVKKRDVARLVAMSRLLDDDPWRNRLRDAIADSDETTMRQMSASPEAVAQPARTIALLASALIGNAPGIERERMFEDRIAAAGLLRRAHPRHAGDFWINYDLALSLSPLGRAHTREALRHATAAVALRPDSDRAVGLLGNAYVNAGEPRRALELLEREIPKHAGSALLHHSLGVARFAAGDFAGAEAADREAMRLDPGVPIFRHNVIVAVMYRGDFDRALREAQTFVKDAPDESLAHLSLAAVLGKRGDAQGAIEAYRTAARLNPNHSGALTSLAIKLNLAHDAKSAIEAATRSIGINPHDAEPWLALGIAQNAINDYKAALVSIRKALEIGISPAGEAVAWCSFGIACVELGDDPGAEAAYRRAIEIDTKLMQPHFNLAVLLRSGKRLHEAVVEIRKAIEAGPPTALCHEHAGRILVEMHDDVAALDEFRKCVAIDPNSGPAHVWIGALLQMKGDADDAIDALQKGLALPLERDDAGTAHEALGRAFWTKWRLEEALAEFRAAVEFIPRHGGAQHDLGRALSTLRRPDEAVDPLRAAFGLTPEVPTVANDLADALVDEGEFAEALSTYRQAQQFAAGHRESLASLRAEAGIERVGMLIRLEDSLDAVFAGKAKPKDAAEASSYISLGSIRKRFAATARFAKAAFASDPRLAEDPLSGTRCNAACAAVLAAAGEGDDADSLTDAERAAWRRQALEWLRAELTRDIASLAGSSSEIVVTAKEMIFGLRHDPDFDSVREEEELEELPVAERDAWRAFWKDVDAALRDIRQAAK